MSESHAPVPERRRRFSFKSAVVKATVCLVGSLVVVIILFWLWETPQAPMLPTLAAFVVGIGALVLFGVRVATLRRFGQPGRYQFSLRLLSVFSLVVALACSWLTVQIHGLTRLRTLYLAGTQVTDVGLEHVARLPNLEYLDVGETRVGRAGVMKLQQRLPDCFIAISYDLR